MIIEERDLVEDVEVVMNETPCQLEIDGSHEVNPQLAGLDKHVWCQRQKRTPADRKMRNTQRLKAYCQQTSESAGCPADQCGKILFTTGQFLSSGIFS